MQHLLWRSARRHREHNVEGLAWLPSLAVGADSTARVRRPRYRAVVERPVVDEFSRCSLSTQHLSVVGLDVELAVAIDVFEMRLHSIDIAPAAGNLHEDFFGTATGGAHALRPSRGRLPSPTALASVAAGSDATGNISGDPKRSLARHRAPPTTLNSR